MTEENKIDEIEEKASARRFKISRQIAEIALCAPLVVLIALSLAGFIGRHRLLELTTHFRLQYLLAALAALLIATLARFLFAVPLALACVAINATLIAPYLLPARSQGQNGKPVARFRLMHANVDCNNHDHDKLLRLIGDAQPDVIVLEELTPEWWRAVAPLRARYVYSKALPRQGGSGIALLSRYPLERADEVVFDASTHPGMTATLNLGDAKANLFILHPPPPLREDKFQYRNGQLREAARRVRAWSRSRIIVGDLNTSLWSPFFADLARDSGLRNARLVAERGGGVLPTWTNPLPRFLQIPIDHCLVSDDIRVLNISTNGDTGSDHRPLIIDLEIDEK